MTDTDIRRALLAQHRGGLSWVDITHRINLLSGDKRVVTMQTLRRFAIEKCPARAATLYWVERWLESRAASSEAAR